MKGPEVWEMRAIVYSRGRIELLITKPEHHNLNNKKIMADIIEKLNEDDDIYPVVEFLKEPMPLIPNYDPSLPTTYQLEPTV